MPSSTTPLTLWRLLQQAEQASPDKGFEYYDSSAQNPKVVVSYGQLITTATNNAKRLVSAGHLKPGQIVGLYFTNHRDNVEWCWSILAAGAVPFIISPLSNDATTLQGQLGNLSQTFEQPTVFTAAKSLPIFEDPQGLNVISVEGILRDAAAESQVILQPAVDDQDLAIILLTSGSTGHSKGVRFTHTQLISSVKAKTSFHSTTADTKFMSWTTFDHSVNFCEVHLQAMYAGSPQILVATADVVTQPDQFFRLLSTHRIAYTFAPNFFLTTITEEFDPANNNDDIDLSALRILLSGGEASRTATLAKTDGILQLLRARKNCITSVYGLSETCSAAFYNTACPEYDAEHEYVFASVGKPLPDAITMRIVDDQGVAVPAGSAGAIQLQGPMVFPSYHNNPTATQACMTADGWFDTGDLGIVDAGGHLSIVGRKKEVVILNGTNYSSFEIEHAIESSNVPGLNMSYTAIFPIYNEARGSEGIVVVFNPTDDQTAPSEAIDAALAAINQALIRVCSQKALEIVPLPRSELPKSTIGKLSRAKLRTAFENGRFDKYRIAAPAEEDELANDDTTDLNLSELGQQVLDIFAAHAKVPKRLLAAPNGLFNAGVDSIGYMRIKKQLEALPSVEHEIPLAVVMSTSSIEGLEDALHALSKAPAVYDPVVPLASSGSKHPLWLFHPGGGETLCWVPLIPYLTDRPLYALRASGLNKAEPVVESLEDMLDCYEVAIKKKQPQGPYAFMGYCFGGMLAFEMAKRFEAKGEEMCFVAGIDTPPRMGTEMGDISGRTILVHFLPAAAGFTTEAATKFAEETDHLSDDEFFNAICDRLGPKLLKEMEINPVWLARWAKVEDTMRGFAKAYEPFGKVSMLDVFVADALPAMKSYKIWRSHIMPGWADFVEPGDQLNIHNIAGDHDSLMKEPHIAVFQDVLNQALTKRGI